MSFDLNYDKVALLLHMDGANASTTFVDSSPNPKTVTPTSATISTTQSKFGGSACSLNGTSAYLNIPASPNLSFGSGDFTIETWINFSAFPTTGNYFCICSSDWNNAGVVKYFLGLKNTSSVYTFEFLCSSDGSSTTSTITTWSGAATSTWVHVAAVRSGNNITVYVNGIAGTPTSFSSSIFGSTGQLFIGASFPPTIPLYLNGYIDEFRVTKGLARYTNTFIPPTKPHPSYGPVWDDNFDKVSLLLHGDGANASTTFIDSGYTPKIITAVGNAQISTTQSKFGGSSMAFDGTGDYLTIPTSSDFSFGSGNFTIETWVYFTALPASPIYSVFCYSDWDVASNNKFWFGLNNTSGVYTLYCFISADGVNAAATVSQVWSGAAISTWAHFAVVRSGNTVTTFINGVAGTPVSFSSSVFGSSGTLGIGGSGSISTWFLNGYMDDLRITKGISRYTSSFVPPARHPEGLISDDFYYDKVSLLLHNNYEGSTTTFKDYSPNPKTITPTAATISQTQSKFGGSAINFNGTTSTLTVPASTDLNLTSGDFTIEFWFYASTIGATGVVLISKDGVFAVSYPQYQVTVSSTGISAFLGNGNGLSPTGTSYTGVTAISAGQWYHFALVKTGSTCKGFLNGNQEWSSAAGTMFEGNKAFQLGHQPSSTGDFFNGYIDDLRVTKGVARYTSAFTPPIQPFPDQPAPYDPNFQNVSLLLHSDGSNGSVGFIDDSYTPKTLTAFGNAVISTTQSKFRGSSAFFDGTGDYISIPTSSDFSFGSGDFTVEAWVNVSTLPSAGGFAGICASDWDVPSNLKFFLGLKNVTGTYSFIINVTSNGSTITEASVVWSGAATGTWTHVAAVRNGNSITVYVNGVAGTPITFSSSIFGTTGPLYIGAYNTTSNFWNGYIDDLRITKGLARYTTTFNPPTSPFFEENPIVPTEWGNVTKVLRFSTDYLNNYNNYLIAINR